MAREKKLDPLKGKRMKWSSHNISMYFSWAVISFVTYYCTDSLGLNAGIVGTVILISKILDAITNFIAATIVDSHSSKKGKGRPWALNIIPMWICIIIMFSVPASWGNTAKYIMIFVMYSLVNAVFATILCCIEAIYLKHAFLEEKQRVSISTISNGLGTVSMTIGMIAMPILISIFEKMPHGWTIMTAAIGIPMALIGSIRYFTIPEVDTEQSMADTKPVTLKDTLQAFFSNKYTILVMFMSMCVQIANQISGTPTTYFFKYVIGDLTKQSVAGTMSIFAMLYLIVLPKLAEKFGRVRMIRVGITVALVMNILRFFVGTNLTLYCVTALLGAMGLITFTVFQNLMLIDSMEYDRWKNNRNLEGAVFAGTSLGTTIGSGLGASLGGLYMNLFGYDGTQAVQSDLAIFGIKSSISFVPAAFMLIILVLMIFYDLDKKLPQIKAELKEREEAPAAAE